MDYDVVIIGAGIHGAGVAQAAAAAGHRVLVLEQYEQPALGTSSRSSKLIHGGLRYLESGQFRLVRECLRERALLLRNAPHLVRLTPFYIPVYRSTRRRPWKIALGLALYSLFSHKAFRRIPRRDWGQLNGLRRDGLDALFCYHDAQTDDARLTRAVLASARELGAEIRMGTRFEAARLEAGGCTLTFSSGGHERRVTARVLVNTAGPWVNRVLEKITPTQHLQPVELVQGTHILVAGRLAHIYYLEAPQDGRAVFVMPWDGCTLIGTTETPYEGDPADVHPLPSEIDYLLAVYNHYFARQLAGSDVVDAFAGLRVLPAGDGHAFSRPRETLMAEDRPGHPRLVSLYGGKLTAYRATAETLMKRLRRVLPARRAVADTRKLRLPDAAWELF